MNVSVKGPYVSDKEREMLRSKKFFYVAVGFCMILAGVFYFLHYSSQRDSTEYYYSESDSMDVVCESAGGTCPDVTGESQNETVCVYVCGAVAEPGVYFFSTGARVADALSAAGGPEDDACPEQLNLAQPVSDGQKIYVPREDETVFPDTGNSADTGLVNINTATEAELVTLPGIGESRARDIIAYRNDSGGFGAVEDIMNVSGIKEASFEKIKDYICV